MRENNAITYSGTGVVDQDMELYSHTYTHIYIKTKHKAVVNIQFTLEKDTINHSPAFSHKKKQNLTGFTLVNLGGKTLDLVEALEVRRDRDTLTRADLGQLLGNLVTDLGRAR